jgi:outer membrane protein assembly factor BamB
VESATRLVRYGVNAPPTAAAGRVYVTTFIEVFCLAAGRDEVLWRGPEMDGVHGAPTVHDGTVYVNSGGYRGVQPHVRAFDAASGEEQWRYDTRSESKGTPAVAGGRAFVNSRDGLHAIDAATGDREFVVPETAYDWATPAATPDAVYTTAYRDGDGAELLAIDAADGTVRWRVPAGSTRHGPPVVADDVVYVGTDDGVVALAADGTEIASLGGAGTPVARVGSVAYAVDGGVLHALDAHGGGVLWSYTTESVRVEDTSGRRIYGVTPVDGAVYVSARDGFHGLGPSR